VRAHAVEENELRERAQGGCRGSFRRWVSLQIQRHGGFGVAGQPDRHPSTAMTINGEKGADFSMRQRESRRERAGQEAEMERDERAEEERGERREVF
jgi:hypothetical protein